jgi:hypothetical protein
MTEQQIPDPPEFVPPPDEIVARIAAEMRGTAKTLKHEEQAALESARAYYRARQEIADREAAERRRKAEIAKQSELERQRQEATQRVVEERKAELRARVRAVSEKISATSPDNRLESIHAHALAADARRIAAEREFARRQWEANCNAIIDDILRMNNPPPEPIPVRIIDDYD